MPPCEWVGKSERRSSTGCPIRREKEGSMVAKTVHGSLRSILDQTIKATCGNFHRKLGVEKLLGVSCILRGRSAQLSLSHKRPFLHQFLGRFSFGKSHDGLGQSYREESHRLNIIIL